MPADRLTARELMTTRFATIGRERPVSAAMESLIAAAAESGAPNAVVVVDGEGRYEGVLTAKLLLRSLMALWSPARAVREDPLLLETDLLDHAADRGTMRVHDALVHGLPVAAPEERLFALLERVCEAEIEVLPVVDAGRAIGLVPATELFYAVARLALTPDDEGIRLER
jgi:CBS domain-containing protein